LKNTIPFGRDCKRGERRPKLSQRGARKKKRKLGGKKLRKGFGSKKRVKEPKCGVCKKKNDWGTSSTLEGGVKEEKGGNSKGNANLGRIASKKGRSTQKHLERNFGRAVVTKRKEPWG